MATAVASHECRPVTSAQPTPLRAKPEIVSVMVYLSRKAHQAVSRQDIAISIHFAIEQNTEDGEIVHSAGALSGALNIDCILLRGLEASDRMRDWLALPKVGPCFCVTEAPIARTFCPLLKCYTTLPYLTLDDSITQPSPSPCHYVGHRWHRSSSPASFPFLHRPSPYVFGPLSRQRHCTCLKPLSLRHYSDCQSLSRDSTHRTPKRAPHLRLAVVRLNTTLLLRHRFVRRAPM
ncbi:uncharacterized protein F5Z01DRAFT_114933 [Emericellopsis atlantica]|uniref:Uncharacterized protein n=1 Tax=Emericellopsis atlantica TaxID=2614577 RepID=A0A9P8CPE4_9HYPO|nr:uncharacterized protein F5Z01DRAFT_114933 [Emericellopsis atlantica]KAG9254040.1 hypothetical protein F5Z01DRAFT_114933 [Emericellopsis atlantica]